MSALPFAYRFRPLSTPAKGLLLCLLLTVSACAETPVPAPETGAAAATSKSAPKPEADPTRLERGKGPDGQETGAAAASAKPAPKPETDVTRLEFGKGPDRQVTLNGVIVQADRNSFLLEGSGGGRTRVVAPTGSSFDGSQFPPGKAIAGFFVQNDTLSGIVGGLSLVDQQGLLFVFEARENEREAGGLHLGSLHVSQLRTDWSAPSIDGCLKVYNVPVEVFELGNRTVVGPGHRALIRQHDTVRLIDVQQSIHREAQQCGEAREESPWTLQYTIRRLDDPAEIARIEASLRPAPDARSIRPDLADRPADPARARDSRD